MTMSDVSGRRREVGTPTPEDLNEFLGGEPEQDVTKMLILSARLSAAAKIKAHYRENR